MHRDRTNERQMRGPRRRNIGHDMLAERMAEWGGGSRRGGHGPGCAGRVRAVATVSAPAIADKRVAEIDRNQGDSRLCCRRQRSAKRSAGR